ncbi:hypothetical protein MRB53_038635 [Persea americana]|nr:hypothetical protein MRB53_038635 [Persea americana]
MAELVGLTAAGVGFLSLAIQLEEVTHKVKALARAFRNAPDYLLDLDEQIKTWSLALRLLERERRRDDCESAALLDLCAHRCQSAVARLEAFVETQRALRQQQQIGQGFEQLGLQQDSLAQQVSVLATVAIRQPEVLPHRVSSSHVTCAAPDIHVPRSRSSQDAQQCKTFATFRDADAGNASEQHAVLVRKYRRAAKWRCSISPWFFAKTWEVSFSIAQNDWGPRIRTSNLIPSDAMIFEACKEGDLHDVMRLFNEDLASPYDYCHDYKGRQAAARSGSVQLCRYLIDIAGWPRLLRDASPLANYAREWQANADEPPTDAGEMYRLMLRQPEASVELPIENRTINIWWWSCPTEECLKVAKQLFPGEYARLPLGTRIGLALSRARGRGFSMAMLMETLACAHVSVELATTTDQHGFTILYALCSRLYRKGNMMEWEYGMREREIWDANKVRDRCKKEYHWTFGPNVTDWNVEVLRSAKLIPVYRLEIMPGSSTTPHENIPRTICWKPADGDDHAALGAWFKVSQIPIASAQFPSAEAGSDKIDLEDQAGQSLMYVARDAFDAALAGTQDDFSSAVHRIMARSLTQRHGPRSCSQPRHRTNEESTYQSLWMRRRQPWLPPFHYCRADGRPRFGELRGEWPPFLGNGITRRACVKGNHGDQRENMQAIIDQGFRSFHRRRRNKKLLAESPWAPYWSPRARGFALSISKAKPRNHFRASSMGEVQLSSLLQYMIRILRREVVSTVQWFRAVKWRSRLVFSAPAKAKLSKCVTCAWLAGISACPLANHPAEICAPHRLRQIVVHAGGEAFLLIALNRTGGKCNDGNRADMQFLFEDSAFTDAFRGHVAIQMGI